jgi:microcystin-dependent protein
VQLPLLRFPTVSRQFQPPNTMAQLSTTYSFTANDNVTNTKLNGIIGNATLNPGAISEQTALVGSVANDDKLIIYDNSAGTIRKVDISVLLQSVSDALATLVGSIAPFPIQPVGGIYSAPSGWLKCDGSQVDIATYQNLYNRIGLLFNPSPTAGKFELPDLRGVFVRGFADTQTVYDSGRVMASRQADALKSHTHGYVRPSGTTGLNNREQDQQAFISTSTVQTSAFGDTETRPVNVALLYCIKF